MLSKSKLCPRTTTSTTAALEDSTSLEGNDAGTNYD